jgi:hypothetical protein
MGAPVQTTFALPQVKAPACEMEILALLHTPGPRVTVARSRSCTLVSTSGLLTLALTLAVIVAARAGAPIPTKGIGTARSQDKVATRKLKANGSPGPHGLSRGTTEVVDFLSTMIALAK